MCRHRGAETHRRREEGGQEQTRATQTEQVRGSEGAGSTLQQPLGSKEESSQHSPRLAGCQVPCAPSPVLAKAEEAA